MTPKNTICLWYDGTALEAAQFYARTFPDSTVGAIHLFVRDEKLAGGKAAPFTYYGRATYRSHEGSEPMSVVFSVDGP